MRRIVIIGSGFAGMHVAQQLSNEVGGRKGLTLTVVTDRSHFFFTPLWASVAGGLTRLSQVALPVESLLDDNVTVAVDEVTDIDLNQRQVVGTSNRYDYDFLVIATGGATNWDGHPEFEHHALPCRNGRDAVDAHEAVQRAFEVAASTTDAAERRRALTFVVVGGGATGVELASHIASRIERDMGEELDPELVAQTRLILIERQPAILPQLDPQLQPFTYDHLRNAGIEVRLGESVVACDAERVQLASHDAIGCSTIFWCGGTRIPEWLTQVGFELDQDGRILVQRTLQAVGQHGVYLAGDVAGVGQNVPTTADVAVHQADVVSRNIIADLAGRSRREWSYEPGGTFISLGRSNAIVSFRGMVLQGRAAQALWGAQTSRLLPSGLRGLSLMPELFAGAFAPRASGGANLLTE